MDPVERHICFLSSISDAVFEGERISIASSASRAGHHQDRYPARVRAINATSADRNACSGSGRNANSMQVMPSPPNGSSNFNKRCCIFLCLRAGKRRRDQLSMMKFIPPGGSGIYRNCCTVISPVVDAIRVLLRPYSSDFAFAEAASLGDHRVSGAPRT